MREDILNIKNEALARITDVKDSAELEEIRIEYLGRNGKVSNYFKELVKATPDEKKNLGMFLNDTKNSINSAISNKKENLVAKLSSSKDWFDLTVPGTKPNVGNLHALTKVLNKVVNIFTYLGYQEADGPEIETDHYNFEALNIPKNHPARDTQMTFYIDTEGTKVKPGEIILRTQTSAMQGRIMEKMKPPFRVIAPGRNFRYEQVDASHGFEFWQLEGFTVDKNIHLTDLFGTINYVLNEIFESDVKIKFATTNFPFVEPGVDTYMKCTICHGKGCPFCKNSGWSEIMPAGMIHPFVLNSAGIDSEKWGGFAFAIGLSRIVNLKYQIQDLRTLTTPDMRILKQF